MFNNKLEIKKMHKYECEFFDIRELVSPKVYEQKGSKCWRFFNPVALQGLDKLRNEFGALTINNWHTGGNRDGSGFHFAGEEKRSEFSGHRQWGSFDIIPHKCTAREMRVHLLGHEPEQNGVLPSIKGFEEITELEIGITWFHVRFCSNIDGVLVYAP
jgi:hypothetical protein